MVRHPSDRQLLRWYDETFDAADPEDKSKPGVAHIRALREIWLKGFETGKREGAREQRKGRGA